MTEVIPYGRQDITEADLAAVAGVLNSDFLTQGPAIAQFEKAFASYIGANYAVAVSNGTAALHLSCLALDFAPGDKAITTPITFAASANCVRYCGGDVLFADIDPESYLIDLQSVEKTLEAQTPGAVKAIIVVDFAGRAVNLEAFRQLADKYSCALIEDACHAPGGYFTDSNGQKQWCGNGQFADLSVFSFHPVKHIACGEGGMITTNNPELYQKLLTLRTHGITRDTALFSNSPALAAGKENATEFPGWYMEMQDLGYNYRLTDFQAALGLSQLKRADQGMERRKEIAKRYTEAFAGKTFVKGMSGYVEGHAYHLFVLEVENRLELYNHLRSRQIFAQIHYFPCHLMPYYRELGWNAGDFPHAESYYNNCISLPMYPTLTDEQQLFVIRTIEDFYPQ